MLAGVIPSPLGHGTSCRKITEWLLPCLLDLWKHVAGPTGCLCGGRAGGGERTSEMMERLGSTSSGFSRWPSLPLLPRHAMLAAPEVRVGAGEGELFQGGFCPSDEGGGTSTRSLAFIFFFFPWLTPASAWHLLKG